jgi:hypothetical protein
VHYKKWEILLGAIGRPDLVFRYLRGKQPSEFDLEEISKFVQSHSPIIVEAGAFDGRDTVTFSQPCKHFVPLHRNAYSSRCCVMESAYARSCNAFRLHHRHLRQLFLKSM